jgi:hypothetical protein
LSAVLLCALAAPALAARQKPALGPSGGGSSRSESATLGSPFLRLLVPKRQVYVGELLPVQILAYFPSDVSASVNGAPQLAASTFTVDQPSEKPRQRTESVGGVSYTVLNYSAELSAVKSGEFQVSAQLPATLRIRESLPGPGDLFARLKSNGLFDFDGFDQDLFDHSMLDDFFGQLREKPVVLSSGLTTVSVLPLPATGQSEGASGAVGHFALTAGAAPRHVAMGEPLTLTVEVAGAGNFDRVKSPALSPDAPFRAYAPQIHFAKLDAKLDGSAVGKKTFTQTLVPTQSGVQAIPPIEFRYFDPRARRYVSVRSEAIRITVDAATAVAAASADSPRRPSARSLPAVAALSRRVWSSLCSLRFFLLIPSALAAVLLLGLGAQRLFRRPGTARAEEAAMARKPERNLRGKLGEMQAAAESGDSQGFFRAARAALQLRLSDKECLHPESITLAELQRRMEGIPVELHDFFLRADEMFYAARNGAAVDLRRYDQLIRAELTKPKGI